MLDDATVAFAFRAIFRRQPSTDQTERFAAFATVDEAIAAMVSEADDTARATTFYQVFFGRLPDAAGLDFWVGQIGTRPEFADTTRGDRQLSEAFFAAGEFEALYGGLETEDAVRAVYENVLGREADAAGLAFWTAQVESPDNRFGLRELGQAFATAAETQATFAPLTDRYLTALATGEEPAEGATLFAFADVLDARDDAYALDEDNALVVGAPEGLLANDQGAFDAPGPLSASVVDQPQSGVVAISASGAFSYVPGPDFAGEDSFTYELTDGSGAAASATVTLTVRPVNDAPTVEDLALATEVGVPLVVEAPGLLEGAEDAEGDALTVSLRTGAVNGTVTLGQAGAFTYTPDAGFTGEDSFTFTLDDGNGGSVNAVATVTVADFPLAAANDAYALEEDTVLTVDAGAGVLANDSLPTSLADALTVSVTEDVASGTLALADDGSFAYTPSADFFGEDGFTYALSDGDGTTVTGRVTLTVEGVNDAPVVAAFAGDAVAGTTEVFETPGLLGGASDADGDALTVTVLEGPENGDVALGPDGAFTYTADDDFEGTDSFTFEVADPDGGTAMATASIGVVLPEPATTEVFTFPVAQQGSYRFSNANTAEEGEIDILRVIFDNGNGTPSEPIGTELSTFRFDEIERLEIVAADDALIQRLTGFDGFGETSATEILLMGGGDVLIVGVTEYQAGTVIDATGLAGNLLFNAFLAPDPVTVIGGTGDDMISGNKDNFSLETGDVLSGGAGDDTLEGSTGFDIVSGGPGEDVFLFRPGDTQAAVSPDGFDVVTDYRPGVDVISVFNSELVLTQTGGAATTALAAIAGGFAEFAEADDTFAERMVAVSNKLAGYRAGAPFGGEVAIFEADGNSYVFVSDDLDALTEGDILVELTGVTGLTEATLNADGDLLLA